MKCCLERIKVITETRIFQRRCSKQAEAGCYVGQRFALQGADRQELQQ